MIRCYIKAIDKEGEESLHKLISFWQSSERFRIIRTMGSRVLFKVATFKPYTVEYWQIDFQSFPYTDKAKEMITNNVFTNLNRFGINENNCEVFFNDK